MDYLWIVSAFVSGYLVKFIKLPSLVGYLIAGFVLHALGIQPIPALDMLSDIGITLLLFTIGLKLNVRSLLRSEIWGTATSHMLITVLLGMSTCLLFGIMQIGAFSEVSLSAAALIGFAISFSSTVCVVQVLEEKGEMLSRHGQIAIGILIIQDIAAVLFVTLATSQSPSYWALLLFGLPLLRPLLSQLLERCGHGELIPLAGIFLAFSGGSLFELLGLKAHLGALIIAMLLSGDKKANELARSLMNFKDLFLVAFFMSIGFTALPTLDMLGTAVILSLILPIKASLFFFILTGLRARGRTSFLAALSLANYSEFGLIVCAASVSFGILDPEWLVIMALAVSISFIFSSLVNLDTHSTYDQWCNQIRRYERTERLLADIFTQPENASVLVVGMGRVGQGAYEAIKNQQNEIIYGIDVNKKCVRKNQEAGRNVIIADAEDPEFWGQVELQKIKLIMFTMPNYLDTLVAAKQLKKLGFNGRMAAIAQYEDEREELLKSGIDVAFNFYENSGTGLAEQCTNLL